MLTEHKHTTPDIIHYGWTIALIMLNNVDAKIPWRLLGVVLTVISFSGIGHPDAATPYGSFSFIGFSGCLLVVGHYIERIVKAWRGPVAPIQPEERKDELSG